MAPHVQEVVALDPYVVRVTFVDGEVRDVDIEPLLDGPVFRPLREPAAFRQVRVDEFQQTICWPGDVDLDPDVIYGHERSAAEPASGGCSPRAPRPSPRARG